MKKIKLLLAALLVAGAWGNAYADVDWTDKTSLITNPSFETDDAIANLKDCGWATDRVTGWTIAPSSSSNAQVGVGNSSSTIQGIGDTFSPSNGDKYFYTRNNWNANTTYSFSQIITRDGDNLPAGLYKVTCKAATYSSNAAFNTLTIGLKEGTGSSVTHNGIVLNVWNTWGVIIYKRADDTNLTIEVNFVPGYGTEGGKHYALLMDDFHLEYISEEDAFTASSSNTIDFSDVINNAGIYNHSTKGTIPRGWTASKHTVGNGNYTEGEKGDTRLEGWNGGNLDIDYNQTVTNLPAGTYTVTANAHERAEVGRTYVYASTDGQEDATGLVNSATDTDITTSELKVSNGTMKFGIRSTANDWVTADDFRISFLGFDVDAVKSDYETAYSNATSARDDAENANIVGTERTTLEGVITTYTTDVTQSYSWYVSAKEALESATTTFVAAKGNYDALVDEIAHAKTLSVATATADGYAATSTSTAASAYANVQALNVEEYIAVTTKYDTDGSALFIPSWVKTNFDSRDDQHWSGVTREYYDKWSGSAFTSSISKTVTLPEGHYVFYAAGRGQVNSPSAVTLKVDYPSDSPTTSLAQSYSMKGDTGKGIDTNGVANFGDGTFANGGSGRGWEWRYIAFDLNEETSVTLKIEGSGNNSWVGACDTKLLTYDNIEVSRRLYNTSKEAAVAARDNSDYNNVIGTERTALEGAINASVTETYAGYNTAAENLTSATASFIGAKDAYDAFVAAKSASYEDNLPYASSTKFDAIATAQGVANATSASDATTKTNAIISAYRKYVESNALAEGVVGAEDKTSLIADPNMDVTYDGTAHTFGAWQVFSQTDGTISLKTEADQPLTDGDGIQYKYADIWKTDNNGGIKQTVSIPSGKYLLTAAARAQNVDGATFGLFAGDARTEIPKMNNTGGVFGNGWNDVSVEFFVTTTTDVEIGVLSGNGKTMWWGATRFRLVKLPCVVLNEDVGYTPETATTDIIMKRTIKADKWNTFCVPFDMTSEEITSQLGTGTEVKELTGAKQNGDNYTMTFSDASSIVAGKPYMVKVPSEVTSISLTNKTIVEDITPTIVGDVTFTGTYTRGTAPMGSFIISDNKFYEVNSEVALKAFRGYITIASPVKALTFEFDDDATGISTIENGQLTIDNSPVYNLAGQRLNKMQKGVNIVNGKKVLY